MVSKKSQIRSVTESKGLVAAISSYDSQSGSNVFRSEIEVTKKLGFFDNFYKKIITTGTHKNSIQKIINNEADIACIDAISYKNIKRAEPEIGDKLRIIGRSIISPAPPLVTHKDSPLCSSMGLIKALNSALNLLDKESKDALRIKRFSFVPFDTYNSHIKKV
jgi:ABC-type phosphate/phosphonate transport system substrate-binding protein